MSCALAVETLDVEPIECLNCEWVCETHQGHEHSSNLVGCGAWSAELQSVTSFSVRHDRK